MAAFDLSSDGDGDLVYATRLGAAARGGGIAVDPGGVAHVVGWTSDDNFPVTDDAPQPEPSSGESSEAFLTSVAADGSLELSTYYGGNGSEDDVFGVAAADAGSVVFGGRTTSDEDLATSNADQTDYPEDVRAAGWVTRFTRDTHPLTPTVAGLQPHTGPPAGGTEVTITGQHLSGVSKVGFDFDEGAASVRCDDNSPRCRVDSDRQLTVTTPAHPQRQAGESVAVTVVNEDLGLSSGGTADFLYGEGTWETIDGELSASRVGHSATVLPDGRVLVTGCLPGSEKGECPGHSEAYDPLEREWRPTGHGEPAGSGPAVLLADDDSTDCGTNCKKLLTIACTAEISCPGITALFDSATDTWAPATPPSAGSLGNPQAARLTDGTVLLTGTGTGDCDHTLDTFSEANTSERYDPRTGTWTITGRLQHGRAWPAGDYTLSALPDGTALVVGGNRGPQCDDEGPFAPPERFYPDEGPLGTWREAADLQPRRWGGFTATVLTGGAVDACGDDCGKLMIAGGYVASKSLPEVNLYDPEAERWEPTGLLPKKRVGHAAAELPSGKILLVGGQRQAAGMPGGIAADAHVYDPATRRWRSAGRMDVARGPVPDTGEAAHTATVISSDAYEFAADSSVCGLDCGKVLVAGGWGNRSAELYTPEPMITGVDTGGRSEVEPGDTVAVSGVGFTHGVREVRFGGQTVDCDPPDEASELPQAEVACRVIDYSTLEVEVPDGVGEVEVPVEVLGAGGLASSPEPLRYAGLPGQVDDLVAAATSASEVTLSWSAVGQTGQVEPPAGEYVVVHSREPIADADDFAAASALCGGVCDAFDPSPAAVGDALELTVGGLAAGTTHHFAVAALDPDGRRGPVSDSVSATTLAGDGDGDDDLPGFDDDGGGDDGGGDAPVAPLEGGVLRLAGADRIATAVAASREAFADDEAGAVVVARADVFADGLAGVPLAAAENAPLLLTGSGELDPRSQAELQRVLADGGEVFLLGGTAALSEAVEQQVAALGYAPTRLAGADRFATAVAIAEDGLGAPDRVLVTTGGVFADAVTAGAAGARHGAAVVLTAGDQLPAATADYLARHQPSEQIAVGGPAARAVPDMAALVGTTRFETAATVADALFAEPTTVGVATGLRFPDALSGGAHIARYQGPMLLSGPDRLHPAAVDYLAARRAYLQSGVIYGGTAALSPAVEDQLADLLP